MSHPPNEKTSPMNASYQPVQQHDPMTSTFNPPPPMYGASPPMPYPYPPYAGPPGAVHVQPQPAIYIASVQSPSEPDYLGYSIFTLLCCCLPLGIAALIFSIMTQGANQRGDHVTAKKYSRLALTLDHTALGLGITSIVVGTVLLIVSRVVLQKQLHETGYGNWNP
ncbi:proline rich transmembrane protein 1B-like [Erythrolamprus reginae]|uniref:proline rich transmembrane protein 1B-like n=1 Tax=Erythrolamprus reginae TaxID=121349 RepID=UPI00396C88D2